MTEVLECGAIVPDCDEEVRAETEEDIMKLAAAHARQAHNIEHIDEALEAKVKAAIKTV